MQLAQLYAGEWVLLAFSVLVLLDIQASILLMIADNKGWKL